MKNWSVVTGLLALAALPVFATPVSFTECPAVGNDTSGCEILITVTAASGGVATAFTVSTSSPDQGSYDGGDGTLIGILNSPSDTGGVFKVSFAVGPDTGTFDFDVHGACLGTGSPLTSAYSPGPAASDCLEGQYQTEDAYDYASSDVTFCSFNLADACVEMSGPAGPLGPGQSTWFSLPGAITAADITMVTPEPSTLLVTAICLLGVVKRRAVFGVAGLRRSSPQHSQS
ncbi:MAG TPA: hypothetical protein VMB85_06295 [Bryobacteraceae bacterium]|nr:hypothetical protein [Bryobacteraceae bacterium]